jgi:hypothetical protein
MSSTDAIINANALTFLMFVIVFVADRQRKMSLAGAVDEHWAALGEYDILHWAWGPFAMFCAWFASRQCISVNIPPEALFYLTCVSITVTLYLACIANCESPRWYQKLAAFAAPAFFYLTCDFIALQIVGRS